MGLFGLVSFVAENMTKEIGIRKVLGASVANVMLTLTKDFCTVDSGSQHHSLANRVLCYE